MDNPFREYLEKLKNKIAIIPNTTNELMKFAHSQGFKLTPYGTELYSGIISQAYENFKACPNCPGLHSCRSDTQGIKYKLEMSPDNKLSLTCFECEFKILDAKTRKINRLLSSSHLPKFFYTKTFANFIRQNNPQAFFAAEQVAKKTDGKGLFLWGKTGTGKTHLAAAIVNLRLTNGHEAVFVTMPDLLSDIRETIKKGSSSSALINIVKDIDFLVMDDMGAERLTDWVCEQLFIIINARLINQKQTVITSNYALSELIDRMAVKDNYGKILDDLPGKRIVSRIREMCRCVETVGKDKRLENIV